MRAHHSPSFRSRNGFWQGSVDAHHAALDVQEGAAAGGGGMTRIELHAEATAIRALWSETAAKAVAAPVMTATPGGAGPSNRASSSPAADNGTSGEGSPNGSVNENKFFNNVPESLEENLKQIDELGGPNTFNHYAWGWTWAGNTPFRRWKRETNIEDQLLFIESIPNPESRDFVEKVLTNIWVYRARLGQPAPSRDMVASGKTPLYETLDQLIDADTE